MVPFPSVSSGRGKRTPSGFDGDAAVAWCQHGSPEELPRIYHRKEWEAGLTGEPLAHRITCISLFEEIGFSYERSKGKKNCVMHTTVVPVKPSRHARVGWHRAHERCSMATEPVLRGDKVELRARREEDVAILHRELHDDVATRVRADSRPWTPIPPESSSSPYLIGEPTPEVAVFSVVENGSGELAGEALIWAIDMHNRLGHLGVSLRPSFRGRGLGTDIVALLCRYGFGIRGLHRLQLETLADNHAMIAAAKNNGFTHEGTLRASAWVDGSFADEVIFGRLAP